MEEHKMTITKEMFAKVYNEIRQQELPDGFDGEMRQLTISFETAWKWFCDDPEQAIAEMLFGLQDMFVDEMMSADQTLLKDALG